jgi:hypothetical protein
MADAASTEKMQESITQCLAEITSTLLSRDKKTDDRWAALLKRQEEKMDLKKRKDDMSMVTAVNRRNVSPDADGAQLFQRPVPRRHRIQNGGRGSGNNLNPGAIAGRRVSDSDNIC